MPYPALDLTKGSLYKNLLRLSLPIVFSNFLQMFYNITDVFWLGKLGVNAKGAVSIAGITFPIIFFLMSFGFGFVVSGTSLISQYKGAGKYEKMKEVVGQFFFILIFFTVIFIIVSFLFIDDILRLLKTPSEIFARAVIYFRLILLGVPFMFIFFVFQSFSHGLGDTISPMKLQILSISINVVLDPVFIFGLGFIPRLEVKGAAIATMIARFVLAVYAFYILRKKFSFILPSKKELKFIPEMMKRIVNISIPSSLGQSFTSLGFIILQGFENTFGITIISVFAIGKRITNLFMIPSMGISNGLAAMVGQNLGAQNIKRAEKSVMVAFIIVIIIMIIGCSIVFFFGTQLTKFFIDDVNLASIGKIMFKLLSIGAFIFAIIFIFMGVFNGAGHTKPTMLFNVLRLWIFRIPLVFILSGKILNLQIFQSGFLHKIFYKMSLPLSDQPYNALWWSMVVSNFLVAVIAFIFYKKGNWKKAKIFT